MESHYPDSWSETAFVSSSWPFGSFWARWKTNNSNKNEVCDADTFIHNQQQPPACFRKAKAQRSTEDEQRGLPLDFNTALIMHETINTGLCAPNHTCAPSLCDQIILLQHGHRSILSCWDDIMLSLRGGVLPGQLRSLQHYHLIDLYIASIVFQRGCSLSWRNITLQSSGQPPTHLSVGLLWFDQSLVPV